MSNLSNSARVNLVRQKGQSTAHFAQQFAIFSQTSGSEIKKRIAPCVVALGLIKFFHLPCHHSYFSLRNCNRAGFIAFKSKQRKELFSGPVFDCVERLSNRFQLDRHFFKESVFDAIGINRFIFVQLNAIHLILIKSNFDRFYIFSNGENFNRDLKYFKIHRSNYDLGFSVRLP